MTASPLFSKERPAIKLFGRFAEGLTPPQRSTLILIAIFWVFLFVVASVRSALADESPFDVLAFRRVIFALFGAALCFTMAKLLHALRARSFAERVAWGLAGALVMAVIYTLFASSTNRLYLPIPGRPPLTWAETGQWVILWLGYFLAWTGTHLALIYSWESADQQRRMSAMAALTQEAQMAALRYQISPHFLFNTLNSISSFIFEGRAQEAEKMVLNLATFFRTTLSIESSPMIPLTEEIALQRLYLDIERERFSERMLVEFDIPARLDSALVPPLILQPLVENSVRHGVERSEGVTHIRISAEATHGELRIVVIDDAHPEGRPRPGTKLGLANVRQRLLVHFGESAGLHAGERDKRGYRAEIRLPLQLT